MNKLKFTQILLLLLMLTACDGCDLCKEPAELPPETQTGANTFGCYVNDKLLIAKKGYGYFGSSNPDAIFIRSENALYLYGAGENGIVNIYVHAPKEQSDSLLSYMNYCLIKGDYYYETKNEQEKVYLIRLDTINKGKVYLTRLDTINKIVSGTFSNLILISSSNTSNRDSVIITQGRFDLKLAMYNN